MIMNYAISSSTKPKNMNFTWNIMKFHNPFHAIDDAIFVNAPHILEADRIFFDNEDMLYLILISEASWIQKCYFQNPRFTS